MYRNKLSMGKIVEILKSKKYSYEKPGYLGQNNVSTILKNPMYCGYFTLGEISKPGDHEPHT